MDAGVSLHQAQERVKIEDLQLYLDWLEEAYERVKHLK